MKIDDIAFNIIRYMSKGIQSPREIANALEISENTVRSRIKALTDAGILKISGLVDPCALSGHQIAFICIRLKPSDILKTSEALSKLPGVISTCVVTGRFDIILEVLFKEDFGMLEFVEQVETHIEDILSAETFIVWKTFAKMVPYVL